MVIKTASDTGTARSDILAAEGAGDSMDVHDAQALSSSQMSKSKLILAIYILWLRAECALQNSLWASVF